MIYSERMMHGWSWERALEANFGRFRVLVRGSVVDRYYDRQHAEAKVADYVLRGHPASLVDSRATP
jgi:hypothetical protein